MAYSPGRLGYATNDEEEQLALALAVSASIADSNGQTGQHNKRASQPQQPQYYPQQRHSQTHNGHQQPYSQGPSSSTPAASHRPYQDYRQHAPQSSIGSSYAASQQPSRHASTAPSSHPCGGCRHSLHGSYISALGRRWHSGCFKCGFCLESIGTGGNMQFAVGCDDNMPYHLDCYKHKYHPECHVCRSFIPERPDGKIEYKENPFWKEKYCPDHQKDGTPQCCACSRLQQKGDEWVRMLDGRDLCLLCLDTVVVDTRDAQPLYEEILAFYRRLGMPHTHKAPLMLVDSRALNEYTEREGGKADGPVFHVRGLTLADVYRSVPSIMRSGRQGSGGLDVDLVGTPVARAQCSVTAILVMYGLPRLLTGCIIAHELMHAWLRMGGVTGLDLAVEEGLCQLLALLWLDSQDGWARSQPFQERLSSYLAYQIRSDVSPVYGDGFRAAYEAFQVVGLRALVQEVTSTGRLPAC